VSKVAEDRAEAPGADILVLPREFSAGGVDGLGLLVDEEDLVDEIAAIHGRRVHAVDVKRIEQGLDGLGFGERFSCIDIDCGELARPSVAAARPRAISEGDDICKVEEVDNVDVDGLTELSVGDGHNGFPAGSNRRHQTVIAYRHDTRRLHGVGRPLGGGSLVKSVSKAIGARNRKLQACRRTDKHSPRCHCQILADSSVGDGHFDDGLQRIIELDDEFGEARFHCRHQPFAIHRDRAFGLGRIGAVCGDVFLDQIRVDASDRKLLHGARCKKQLRRRGEELHTLSLRYAARVDPRIGKYRSVAAIVVVHRAGRESQEGCSRRNVREVECALVGANFLKAKYAVGIRRGWVLYYAFRIAINDVNIRECAVAVHVPDEGSQFRNSVRSKSIPQCVQVESNASCTMDADARCPFSTSRINPAEAVFQLLSEITQHVVVAGAEGVAFVKGESDSIQVDRHFGLRDEEDRINEFGSFDWRWIDAVRRQRSHSTRRRCRPPS
jgi:hypothetical protein